jgi:DinB superfamily
MAPQERSEIVHNLQRSREEFLAAVAGLSDEQAKAKTDPERWSVLECVEHVASVEDRFLGWLDQAEKLDARRMDREKELRLMAMIPDRSVRLKAPEAVVPTGQYKRLEDAVARFEALRARSIQFAEKPGDLYCLAREHPRWGQLNGVELLIIIAGHSRRHGEQIRELRAELERKQLA